MKNLIEEIRASTALCYYGASLSFIHTLTAFFWRNKATRVLGNSFESICWPYFPDCHHFHGASAVLINSFILLYGLASLVVAAQFLRRKITWAWAGLLLLTAVKFALLSLDYRMHGNFHYSPLLIQAGFLLVPGRARFLPVLFCLIYFSAGTLKLNQEWLSGLSIAPFTPVPQPYLGWLLKAAVVMELLVVWGVLFKSKIIFAFSFFCLVVFHSFSWHVIGYFYPLTMALLLSLLILLRFEPAAGRPRRHHYVLWATFLLAQIVPWLGGGDSALTGEGRAFALNMFDAHSECQTYIFVKSKGAIVEVSAPHTGMGVRIHCDPLVFFNEVKNECRARADDPEFLNIDWHLLSRRQSDRSYSRIIDEQDFCAKVNNYSLWPVNSFVQKNGPLERPKNPENTSYRWTAPVPEHPPAAIAGEVTSMFRSDARRSGVVAFTGRTPARPVELWRRNVGNIGIHIASKASPAVDDSGIYVGGDSSWFYAFRHDGSIKWRFYVSNSERGIHGTAALDEKFVYFGAYNGRLYKLDKESGALIWVHQVGDALGASPLLHGEFIYLGVDTVQPNGYLAKLKRDDGKLVWVTKPLGDQTVSSPASYQDLIVLGGNSGVMRAFHDSDGAPAWETPIGSEIKSTPLVVGGALYFTSGQGGLYKLAADSGHVLWRADLGSGSQSSPTLWAEKNLLLAATKGGAIVGVTASSGQLKWKIKTGEDMNNASALLMAGPAGGYFVIACGARALCGIDDKGLVKFKHQLKGQLTGVPVYYKGVLYLSENEPGDLLALKINN